MLKIDPILVFRLIEKRAHQPFRIQGSRATTVHAVANFDPAHDRHTFSFPLSRQQEIGEELAKATGRPLCNFYLADVILPDGLGDMPAEIDTLKAEIERLTAEVARLTELKVVPIGKQKVKTSKPLDEMTHKELLRYAMSIGLPSPSMAAKSGRKSDLLTAIRNFENPVRQNASGDPAPAECPASQAAA